MQGILNFLTMERAQVSMEFILITGGVLIAALTIWSLQGVIRSFANTTVRWVESERNATIVKITR